jgi:hypothetical protein
MNLSSEQTPIFIESLIQSARADFLASFSELLFALSLLERRPHVPLENPDIDQALTKARWLLGVAIETFDRLAVALKNVNISARERQATTETEIAPLLEKAIQSGILVDCPPAAGSATQLVMRRDTGQIIIEFRNELGSCRDAMSKLNKDSKLSLEHLHSVLSTYMNCMIKGQYLAYLNSVA